MSAITSWETTWWSVPRHGNWNRVARNYPGNFPPQIARELIRRYSRPGDRVLDPFCGSGTSLVEALRLSRRGVGTDISRRATKLARAALLLQGDRGEYRQVVFESDARYLDFLESGSFDLAILHPPYSDMIRYNPDDPRDLSNFHRVDEFCENLDLVFREIHRLLRPGGTCALIIGDLRRMGFYVPLSISALVTALDSGFVLKEEIVKRQWNCSSTGRWENRMRRFLLIAHEHIYVLEKGNNAAQEERFRQLLI